MTKLGGRPDLPLGTEWPALQGSPLSFVAQIDLAQVTIFDTRSELPSSGRLSFFYCSDCREGVGDPHPAGVVLFSEAGSPLSRREFPDTLATSQRFEALPLLPELEMTLPTRADPQLEALSLSMDESNTYGKLLLDRDEAVAHRLLGHPNAVQPAHFQPELCARTLPASFEGADHVADWALLAQFDSDPSTQMCWNDAGRLYYWISRNDLAGRRLDRVHLIEQSH